MKFSVRDICCLRDVRFVSRFECGKRLVNILLLDVISLMLRIIVIFLS